MRALRENTRQLIHVSVVLFALTLAYLPASWAFLLAFSSFIHNILLLPKYAPSLFRQKESLMQGIAVYPLMVSVLILLFADNLIFAGGAWAILAFGDGFSSLFGRTWRITSLPWHPNKTFGGTLGFVLMATLGAVLFMCWIGPYPTMKHVFFVAFCASVISAIYESLPLPWDDNIVVGLTSGAFLALMWDVNLQLSPQTISGGWWGIALFVNFGIAALAWWLHLINTTGAVSGFLIGTFILAMGGTNLYILLVLFFVLASLATKVGYEDKQILGIAQENKGKRGANHAFANGILALLAAILLGMTDGMDHHLIIFYCAVLATALSDTVSSELGQVFGKDPFLPTSFRRVPPGTVGAISLEGTMWGMASTVVFAFAAWMISSLSILAVPAVIVGGWVGFYMESYIGSLWTEDGLEVNNEWMNVLNTFIGGTVALMLAFVTGVL